MKPRFTKARKEQLDQLCNDLAEDMNQQHWKRQDLIDCINYLGDELYMKQQKLNAVRSECCLDALKLANKAMKYMK